MAHERLANTVEDLERLEVMLTKRIDEIETRRASLEHERQLVREKIEQLKKKA